MRTPTEILQDTGTPAIERARELMTYGRSGQIDAWTGPSSIEALIVGLPPLEAMEVLEVARAAIGPASAPSL